MSHVLLASLLVLLGGCADGVAQPAADGSPATAPAAVRDVNVATLKADLDQGAVRLLVDVRTPGEFASGHVPGARNIPLAELEGRIGELGPKGAEVHLVCQSGGRSARAAATLATMGFRPVDVEGGTAAWRAAGYPVE